MVKMFEILIPNKRASFFVSLPISLQKCQRRKFEFLRDARSIHVCSARKLHTRTFSDDLMGCVQFEGSQGSRRRFRTNPLVITQTAGCLVHRRVFD